MHRTLLLALVSVLATGASAMASSYDAAPEVSGSPEPGGSGGVVRASMDVAAPPAVVWSVLTDCARAPRFMPKLISCKVLQKGPGDRWEIREHRIKGPIFKPVLRNVFHADFEPPARLAFRKIEGDWKRSDGEWRLSPIQGGKGAHVSYEIHAAVAGPVPESMARAAVSKGVTEAMLALRKECVAEYAKGGGSGGT